MKNVLLLGLILLAAGCSKEPKGGPNFRTLNDANNRPVVGWDFQSGDIHYFQSKDAAARALISQLLVIQSQYDCTPKPPPPPAAPATPAKPEEKKPTK